MTTRTYWLGLTVIVIISIIMKYLFSWTRFSLVQSSNMLFLETSFEMVLKIIKGKARHIGYDQQLTMELLHI